MSRSKRAQPSPALVVAVVALVAGLAGTAVGGVAVKALNKKEKQQVKKISKKQARKLNRKIVLTPGPGARPHHRRDRTCRSERRRERRRA